MQKPSYIPDKKQAEVELEAVDSMAVLGRQLMALKEEKEELAEELKSVNSLIEEKENALSEMMVARSIDLFRVDGITFYTKEETYPSVKKDALEDFIVWLDSNGAGAIAKRSVHPMTLRAWVKERIENAQELPPQVSIFTKTEVNTRRSNKKG